MWQEYPELISFGALKALSVGESGGDTFICFHGYGANAYDLASLAPAMRLPKYQWYFPQGPLTVDIGGGFSGQAWFPIDLRAHEAAAQRGEEVDYSQIRPKGSQEACDKALSFIRTLKVAPERLVLGGFSQGAMLAAFVAMSMVKAPKALVLFSGTAFDIGTIAKKAPAHKGLRFFQAHGEADQVLPFSGAEKLFATLESAGWIGEWCPFRGGHEIPPPVLLQARHFLTSL